MSLCVAVLTVLAAATDFGRETVLIAPEPPNPVQLTRKARGLREVPLFDVEHPHGGGRIKGKDGKIPVYDMPSYIMGNKRVCQLRFPWGGLDEFVQRSLVSIHCPDGKGFSVAFNREDCIPVDEKDFARWGIEAQYEYAVDAKTETVRYRQPYVSKRTRDLKCLSFTMRKTGRPGEVEIVWDGGGDEIGFIIRSNDDYRNWKSMSLGGEKFSATPDDQVLTGGKTVVREFKDGSKFMGEDMETSACVTGLPKGPARACESAWDIIRGNTHRRLNIYTAKATTGRILIDLGESPRQEQNVNKFPPVNGLDFSLFNGIHFPRPATRNELRNPSFEEGFYHWTYLAGRYDKDSGYEIVNGGVKGKRALLFKSRIGREEACHLRSPMLYSMPMQLVPDEKYTLSFYIKRASEPGRVGRKVEAVVSLGSNCRNATVPGDFMYGDAGRTQDAYFEATDEWTRHVRTFTAGNGGFRVVLGAVEGDVLFDAFQLERGEKATDFVANPIEAVITSAAEDNQLAPDAPKCLGVRLVGEPGTRGKVKVTISNFYRETVYEESFVVTLGASGLVERPLGPGSEKIGMGVFPVRIDVKASPPTSRSPDISTSYQRISVMKPLMDTKRPTARLFGTLIWPTRFGKPETLVRKLREWGVGSVSWGGVSKKEHPSRDFDLLYGEGIVNVQHAIGNDLLREKKLDLSLFEDRKDSFKIYDICRDFCMNPISDEQERELTRAMTAYLKDADPRSAQALSWWNEEEGGPGLVQKEKFEEYFRFQKVMVDAIMADGHRFKTTYSSGMSSIVDYKLPILESYLATAKKHGVVYDAMTFHAYGHLDGGKLGFYDLDKQVGKIVKIMEKYGYGDETEMFITELGNEIQLYIPEWFTLNGDTYQNGMPEYSFGHYEALNAASCARIWLMMLKYHPKMRHTNVWNSRPFMDAQFTPLFWCKALNTVANLFPDCTFVADVRPADRIRGYAFRDANGKGIAAIWQTDPMVDASEAPCPIASVRFSQPVRYVDLMQNERFVKPKQGESRFALTYAPLFIIANDVDRLVSDLCKAKIEFSESTVDARRGESHALAGGEQEVINNLKR